MQSGHAPHLADSLSQETVSHAAPVAAAPSTAQQDGGGAQTSRTTSRLRKVSMSTPQPSQPGCALDDVDRALLQHMQNLLLTLLDATTGSSDGVCLP